MAQPTRPGNHERGWNDPPVFLHSPNAGTVVTPTKRKSLLTKRVAHPGVCHQPSSAPDGSSCPQMAAPPAVGNLVLLPPSAGTDVPRFAAPIIIPRMSPPSVDMTNPLMNAAQVAAPDVDGIPDCDDDRQLRCFVKSRLQRVLCDCRHALAPKVAEDVERKLDLLDSMWDTGQISYPVKSTMARLVTALHKRNCDLAHQLHIGLMIDYVSEVSGWMVGIKRLIHEARNVDAPLSPTDGATFAHVDTGAENRAESANDIGPPAASVDTDVKTDVTNNARDGAAVQ